MNQIGNNIKKLRRVKEVTQEQLAEHLNVTRQTISGWETGKNQPDIETLQWIAEYFGVSVEEVIYGRSVQKKTEEGTEAKEGWKESLPFARQEEGYSRRRFGREIIKSGTALALVISYVEWRSIGWAIFHGLLGWFYVIYYMIRY